MEEGTFRAAPTYHVTTGAGLNFDGAVAMLGEFIDNSISAYREAHEGATGITRNTEAASGSSHEEVITIVLTYNSSAVNHSAWEAGSRSKPCYVTVFDTATGMGRAGLQKWATMVSQSINQSIYAFTSRINRIDG